MSESEKELKNILKRANKDIVATAFITLFMPWAGYLYTVRYKAALIAFFVMFFIISVKKANSLFVFFLLGAAVENSISVRKAREIVEQKVLQSASDRYAHLPDAKMQILKIGKQRGEVTLADLVIETGLPPEQVREVVMGLERQDLVRSYNREHDGAVVYRVI
ncbi:MAG TPA: hypothetical protein V6C85_23235 [Allocoleopsis sp.]